MAQKRMFSHSVVETDRFLDMPTSAQCLYFHLGMHGDDDGFVASPRRITALCGCNPDDLKLLITKGFVYPFESGVCVIVDWRLNNTLKNDRYRPTIYTAEKALLEENVPCFQNVSEMFPQQSVTQQNVTESGTADKPPKRPRITPPTLEEVAAYCAVRGNNVDPQHFYDYFSVGDWKDSEGKPVRNWKQKLITWEKKERAEKKAEGTSAYEREL